MRLEKKIIKWAEEKGIFEKSNPIKQHDKTLEEVMEIRDGIVALNTLRKSAIVSGKKYLVEQAQEEIKDGIGDTIVTLVLQAKMNNLTIDECVEHAYNVIKNRTGKMINGQFVKD